MHRSNLSGDLALGSFLAQAVAPAPLGADWALLGVYSKPQLLPEPELGGPFDKDSQGKPFVKDEIKNTVLTRRDLKRPAAAADKPGQPTPPK